MRKGLTNFDNEMRIGRQRIDEDRKIDMPRHNQSKRALNNKISILRKQSKKCPRCANDKIIKNEVSGTLKCSKCKTIIGR